MSDDWWTERNQYKRIAGLEEDLSYVTASLSSARASQNRLKAELSKVRGSLEQRLDRLSAAFDAFVEISDVRVTLGLFDSHGRVRHQAKQLLEGAGLPDVTDVDGYWLAPALAALRGVADGAVDDAELALATARDPLRTNVFHVLLTSATGGRKPVPTLAAALPDALPGSLPGYQRALWLLAADGFFGAEGWELMRERCAEFVAGLPSGALSLSEVAVAKAVVNLPKDLDGGGTLATALQGCERLSTLRTWVTKTLDGYTGEPPADPDPLVRRSLELLIDEGSSVELPLLARERELRAVIEGQGASSTTWDTPVGETVKLLRGDVADEGHPNRRALAVRAGAPELLSLAEKFATDAQLEAPTSLDVRTRYGKVLITTSGPDPSSMDRALEVAERASRVTSNRRPVAIGAAVVAVAFVVLAIVAGWGWLFVAAGAATVAVYQWLAAGKEQRNAVTEARYARESLRKEVASRVESFVKARAELRTRQLTVPDDLAALRSALS